MPDRSESRSKTDIATMRIIDQDEYQVSFANHLQIVHEPQGFYMTFAQAEPPRSNEEIRRLADGSIDLQAKTVVRMAVRPADFARFVEAMMANLEKYRQNVQQMQEGEESNDG